MIFGALGNSSLPMGVAFQKATLLLIDGVDRSGLVTSGGLSRSKELGARTSLRVSLTDKTGAYAPEEGQSVAFWWRGVLKFAGSIEKVQAKEINGSAGERFTLRCVDYSQILDRRVIAATFEAENQKAGDIATLIVESLADEGFTMGQVDDSVFITKAVFPYIPASQCLQELADLAGMTWSVSPEKVVSFTSRETFPSSFALSDASKPYKNMEIEDSRASIKNRIYLKAGKSRTDPQTELFAGDGKRITFTTGFPLAEVPTIEVDTGGGYVAKTVGIRGVDTGKDWYWQKDNNQLTQDAGGTVLTTAHTLRVTYTGLFPLRLEGTEDGSIAERAAIEGGTGYYDAVEEDERIEERQMAVEKMRQLLRRFAYPPRRIMFDTFEETVTAGHTFEVDLTAEGISGTFLAIRAEERYFFNVAPDGLVETRITATDGEAGEIWLDFYRALERNGKTFSIRENEGLGLGPTKFDYVTLDDSTSTATALDDGSNDPYTCLHMPGDASPSEMKRAIGKFVIGGGNR